MTVLNLGGWPLLGVYCFSMFVWPWIGGDGTWKHVQLVWDRWQTFNAAALAFVASLVAFNIARFNEEHQRQREFTAAKAFLPSTLSGLMDYCSGSAALFVDVWKHGPDSSAPCPQPPEDHRTVLSDCIRHADPSVGSYLAHILVELQVNHARLHDRDISRLTLISYLFRLGRLYALLGKLFPYARGEVEECCDSQLDWEAFRSAYSLLDVDVDGISIDQKNNLREITTRWLVRQAKP